MAATLETISSISLRIPRSGHPAFLVLWWISNEDSLPPPPHCHGFLAHAVSLYLSIATGLVHVQGTGGLSMHCRVWFSAGALWRPVVVFSWAQDSPNQRLSKGQRNKGSFPSGQKSENLLVHTPGRNCGKQRYTLPFEADKLLFGFFRVTRCKIGAWVL